jgi:DUF1680 family protein
MIQTITHFQGLLGDALEANLRGRLARFIVGPASPAIALFAPQVRDGNLEGDWYGEHAGKWLVATAQAVARSDDPGLRTCLREVADYLLSVQEPDGYLGTYAASRRFTVPQPPKPATWDGAPALRTWDIWVHAYLVLGLLETSRTLGDARYREAAARIGRLCLRALREGIDITDLGNHHGMSATVLLDAAVELHGATGDADFLDLALRIVAQADANPALRLVTRALDGADASEIGTGKAYQLLWNATALAKLHRATGEARYLHAAQAIWGSVHAHHLSLGGGPWGGVAHRSREVFNPAGVFSPQGYVETCSTLAWIQLNRELLAITGDARHAEEIERSAYNDLLGAQAPNGEDWCYYVFPNGRRVHTTYWRCCKSSGAMALEELPALAHSVRGDVASVQLYAACTASLALPGGTVRLVQRTAYPYDGDVRVELGMEAPTSFALRLRIPSWAVGAHVAVNGERVETRIAAGEYAELRREWRDGDAVELHFPMAPRLHHATNRNVQESRAPDGGLVRQEVLHDGFVALSRGPLVYATGLVDGYKTCECIHPPDPAQVRELPGIAGAPVALELAPTGRAPIRFEPWFGLGARADGAWRITWLSLAPTPAGPKNL